MKLKKTTYILFILYFFFLGYLLFIRGINYQDTEFLTVNFIPLSTMKRYFGLLVIGEYRDFIINIIGNIVVFIPVGFFVISRMFKKRIVILIVMTLGIPIIIEMIQYLFSVGIMDIDDVILNVLGILIGYLVFYGVKHGK